MSTWPGSSRFFEVRRAFSLRAEVSPRAGLVLCEDGSGAEFVHGLTTDGVIFKFAESNVDLRTTPVNGFNQDYRGSEFAGATGTESCRTSTGNGRRPRTRHNQ